MTDLATRLIQRWDELAQERPLTQWRKIVRYSLPAEAAAFGVDPDGPLTSPTVDDTIRECLDSMVEGIDDMLFHQDAYEVVPRDDGEANTGGYASRWADYATHNLNAAINNPLTGWATTRHLTERSTCGLGHGVMFVTERPGSHLVCKFEPASEVVIAENADGVVDTRIRRYPMTLRQVVETWGDRASDQVRNRIDRFPGEKIDIIHGVYPRWEVMPGQHRMRMPWASCYIEVQTKKVLDEGGFMEFPFMIPRFDRRSCSPYGWSQVMTVLDEVLRVNSMGRSNLAAGQRISNPETYYPDGMFARGLSAMRRPGADHVYNTSAAGQNPEVRQFPGPAQLPIPMEQEADRRNMIREIMFYYLFQPPESPNMTATEWIGRQNQMRRRIGGPVGRFEQEMAVPAGKRFFGILLRAGAIEPPQPPYSLSDFEVEFSSPVARMKRLTKAESIQRTLEASALVAQFDPRAIANIDGDESVRELHEAYGAPAVMLRSRDDVAQQRAADDQKQQIAELGQAAITGATAAKLAAEAGRAGGV